MSALDRLQEKKDKESFQESLLHHSDCAFEQEFSLLALKIYAESLPYLEQIAKNGSIEEVEELFLKKKDIKEWDLSKQGFVSKLNELVLRYFQTIQKNGLPSIFESGHRLSVLKKDLDMVMDSADAFREFSEEKWQEFAASSSQNTNSESIAFKAMKDGDEIPHFVEDFNNHFRAREIYREDALALIHQIKSKVWIYEAGYQKIPKAKEAPNARSALMQLYYCDDVDVKEQALSALTELLECDPLEMDSAYNLVELQSCLYEEVKASKSQNLNTKLQRQLIKAYAISLECILLHAAAKHLNALTDETKEQIWSGAEDLKNYNIVQDEEISFWSEYAIQGAQHIKTSTSTAMDWLKRIALVARAGLQIGAITQEPGEIANLMEGAIANLREAVHHIERHKGWFEELLVLKKLSRYSIYDIHSFRQITAKLQKRKREDPEEMLLYGIASTLEYTILSSPSPLIQEEGIKLLLQFYSIDQPLIRSRIILAFTEMLSSPMLRLRNSSYLILKLLQASERGSHISHSQSFQGLPQIQDITVNEAYPEGIKIQKTGIFENVIKFLIRRTAEIKEEEDYGGHSFLTLLSSSKEEEVIPHLIQCFTELSPEFQEPDIYGRTAYHIATLRQNISIVTHIHHHTNIDIDAQEYDSLNTALHLAAGVKNVNMTKAILSCEPDPNLQNREGETPLHIAVKMQSYRVAQMLLEHGADPSKTDNRGTTVLNNAIASDDVRMVDLLLKFDAKVAEEVHHLSPIIIAAQEKAENTLMHLIEGKKGSLTALEALEILKMICESGDTLSCSDDFCRFHILRENTHTNYSRAFSQYRSFPKPRLTSSNAVSLSGARRKFSNTPGTISDRSKKLSRKNGRKTLYELPPTIDDFGNTELIHMAKHTTWLDTLRERAEDVKLVNQPNYLGLTPLHVAVLYRNYKAIKILLKSKAEIDESDIQGFTPLHFAAYLHDKKLIKQLIKGGANPSRQNYNGDTPLLILCGNFPERKPKTCASINYDISRVATTDEEDIEMIDLLIDAGSSPFAQDFMGNNSLHHAAQHGTEGTMQHLFDTYPRLLWQKNNKGLLPVEEAVRIRKSANARSLMRETTAVRLDTLHEEYINKTENKITLGNLLAHAGEADLFENLIGKNPSIAYHPDGTRLKKTPLHTAAEAGQLPILNIYLANQLKIDMEDGFGNTPLHLAALSDNIEFLSSLIRARSRISKTNHDGRTALHLASTKDNRECVNLLLDRQPALVRVQDGHGDTPLHLACKYGSNNTASRLIQGSIEGVDQYVNDNGNTPFHIACSNGHKSIAEELRNAGADLEARDIFGNTPLLLAAQQGHLKTIEYLLEVGADLSAKDDDGETALHKAVFNHHDKVVKRLLQKNKKLFIPTARALVHQADLRGESALHELTKRKVSGELAQKQEKILDLLLGAGANLAMRNELGETFLHSVCQRGFDNLLARLIRTYKNSKRKPYDFHTKDHRDNRPIHLAAKANQRKIISILIEEDVNLNCKNQNGMTALLIAASCGHYTIAEKLIRAGANLRATDKSDRCILHHLLSNPELGERGERLLKIILRLDPTLLDKKDSDGNRPLHLLALNNHHSCLETVLLNMPGKAAQREALVWKVNYEGNSAFDIAKQHNFHDLCKGITNFEKSELGADVADWYKKKRAIRLMKQNGPRFLKKEFLELHRERVRELESLATVHATVDQS